MNETALFVCTHNSARSQMADGLLRHQGGDRFEVYSAGTEPGSLHPLVIRAMAELGIDISSQSSELVDRFLGERFDFAITVCDQARETCPIFPGADHQLHWSLPVPAAVQGTEEERLDAFRSLRDQIAARIGQFVLNETEREKLRKEEPR